MDPARAQRLKAAARTQNISESEFVRRALDVAFADLTDGSLYDDLKELGVIGIGHLGPHSAERHSDHFRERLVTPRQR